jgi:peptidoglycan/xylan/chitin deacetylase (PgdA/CDA1 family)
MTTLEPGPRPPAVVHVDLDGARHIYAAHGWGYEAPTDPIFDSGLSSALECFERVGVRATLFVIAEDLEDPNRRRLLADAVRAGHEIGSHTVTHPRLTALSRADKTREIHESRARIGSALGVEVSGFRAPGFHIDAETLDVISEAGYVYDSSRLAGRQGTPAQPYHPVPGRRLLELPVPTRAPGASPFHPSYSLVLGDWFFRGGLRSWGRTAAPFVCLFHLNDFAEPVPRRHLPGWQASLYTLSYLSAARKRARCESMLRLVATQFRIDTTAGLLATAGPSAVRRPS